MTDHATPTEIRDLLSAVADADGVEALSEQFVLGLGDARLGHRHHFRRTEGRLAGLIACAGEEAEMAVHPDFRRQGIGSALLADAAPAAVWAHGNLASAQGFATAQGARITRRLLVMAIAGQALEAAVEGAGEAAAASASDLEWWTYADAVGEWGADAVDAAWVSANNEAFSWHPEQGGWDVARLRRGMEAEWFTERDVILLIDRSGGTFQVAGFHWTKFHGADEASGTVTGEVYVVGLADAYRGRGLGQPLLQAGMMRQWERGARRVILYVEADNEPAVAVYRKLGFDVAEEHVVYSLATSQK